MAKEGRAWINCPLPRSEKVQEDNPHSEVVDKIASFGGFILLCLAYLHSMLGSIVASRGGSVHISGWLSSASWWFGIIGAILIIGRPGGKKSSE